MNQQRWAAIQAAFLELADLKGAERKRRLSELGSDPRLRAAVESLLTADAAIDERLAHIERTLCSPAVAIPDALGLSGRTISHFRVMEPLGAGGMGVVYRAEDARLGRIVALKFLLPHLSLQASAKARFLLEARSAATLDHPNLCTVHEVGETEDGRLFLAMPLYSGETLQTRLAREGSLPAEVTLGIAQQITQGLARAHAAGIVHRDLKPGNIMLLPDGTVKILDFGLAKLADQELSVASLRLGTIYYMAPEQIRGRTVDGRTDLWALGVILYEMVTGRRPFVGDQEGAVSYAIVHDEPVRPSALRPMTREAEEFILTLLQKDPRDRFANATVVGDALKGALIDGVPRRTTVKLRRVMLGAAAVLTGWLLIGRPRAAERSLAVLPCVSASNDSNREYLSDGVTADLIAGLSRAGGFDKIIASASARQYKNSAKTPTKIGAELGVSSLLLCRYDEDTSLYRLGLQLVNAGDGSIRWANEYDGPLSAPRTQLPLGVVRDVLTAAGVHDAGRLTAERPHDPVALNLIKQGWFLHNKLTREGLRESIVLFRQALEHDSTVADAYVGLANAYFELGIAHGDMDPREAFPLVREAATRALSLDAGSAGAHAMLGVYEWGFGWNWRVAEQELRRAVELDPASSWSHDNLGFVYAALGRYRESVAEGRRATEVDPAVAAMWGDAGVQYFSAGQYREALPFIERALAMDSSAPPYHWILGAVLVEMGELRRGAAELERTVDLAGGGEYWHGYLGYARALAGDTAAAQRVLRLLETSWRTRATGAVAGAIAIVHVGLGNRDDAFRWLDEAYRLRCSTLAFTVTTAPGRRLAADPRYDELLRRLHLRT